jgi:PAS domain S-box-containing protein
VILRQIIDLVPHFVSAKDLDGRYLLANRALADAYGKTARELEGMTVLELARSAEEARGYRASDLEVLSGRSAKLVVDETITDARGNLRSLSTLKIPFSFAGIAVVLGVSTDVTERKQLERQLVHAQKVEGLGRLAGGVAHDFNNILSAILSFAELLSEDLTDRPECQKDAESIRDAAMRASELTRQLLTFSRQGEAHPIAVDVAELIGKLERLLQHVVGEDVALRMVSEPGVQVVNVDPGRLEQVIVNLAINARDAMPIGGKLVVRIRNATRETVAQHTGVPAEGDWVEISVIDTGIGMTPETQARIFEPFFTTKEIGKGTGLGLATSYGIVKQAGGHLVATSTLGVGTTFHVFLPCSYEKAAPSIKEDARQPVRPGDETVLVIEDNSFVRKTTTRALQRAGYRVISCASPSEGIEVMSAHHGELDLLVTDIVMPGMSGFQVADEAARLRPDMKVLFVSGYGPDIIDGRGSNRERVRLLSKPFTPAQLAHEVRCILDDRERTSIPPVEESHARIARPSSMDARGSTGSDR